MIVSDQISIVPFSRALVLLCSLHGECFSSIVCSFPTLAHSWTLSKTGSTTRDKNKTRKRKQDRITYDTYVLLWKFCRRSHTNSCLLSSQSFLARNVGNKNYRNRMNFSSHFFQYLIPHLIRSTCLTILLLLYSFDQAKVFLYFADIFFNVNF